jgi:multiple sugar transport system substrate-binding protein
MLRKRIQILVMLMVAAVFVAACGGSNQSNSGSSSGPVSMVWAGWSGEEEAFKPTINAMRDSWAAEQGNASVSFLGWPWANVLEQVIIRSQTNEQMDIVQLEAGWLKTLVDAGVLADLNEVVEEAWLKDNFSDAMLAAGQIDGKQYALPWTMAGMGLSYNPDIFEKAGITQIPETIAEFEAALEKIKAYDSTIIPFGMVTKDAGSMAPDIEMWLWTFGGSVFDDAGKVVINNEQGIQTLEWIKSLHDRGLIKMDISRGKEARPLFAQGKVAVYDDAILARTIAASNGVPEAELDQKIKPMKRPVLNAGDEPQNRLWGHMLGVVSYSKHQDLAADFIQHVVGEEQGVFYFEQNGMPPVTNKAIANDVIQQDEFTKLWLEYTAGSKRPTTENYSQKKELDNIVTEEVQAALLGTKTVKKALDDAATRIESQVK